MNIYGKNCYKNGYEQAVLDMENKTGYFLIQRIIGLFLMVISLLLWKIEPITIIITIWLLIIGIAMMITNKPIIIGYPEE